MTYIYQKISEGVFLDRFREMGREKQFSPEGRIALFNYLEEIAEDTGEPIEMDVIALCCEFTEYANIAEYNCERGTNYESWDDAERLVARITRWDCETDTYHDQEGAIIHNH